jgi:hypothetical protein
MSGFDAGNVVLAMDWDFSKFGAGKGTVPEPSDVKIERFLRKYRVIANQALNAAGSAIVLEDDPKLLQDEEGNPKIPTLADAIAVMKQIDLEDDGTMQSRQVAEQMLDLFDWFCDGKPGRGQLQQLPNRIRAAFYGWVVGQVTNPDFGPAADTKPLLNLVNGG